MDLRRLRYFLAVAEHENFHRAADALHVAQSALSRHVADLEIEIGAALFERFAKGVRLTPVGEVFMAEARDTVLSLDRAFMRARKAANGTVGRLTIGMNDIAARNRLVAVRIRDFRQRYPEIECEFELMVSTEQIRALELGRIDIGILIERPRRAEFNFLTVAHDPFQIALPHGHRLAGKERIEVADLVGEPFVTVKMSTYWLPQTRLLSRCRSLGLVPDIVQEASNDQMQMGFIAAGFGIGFVNRSASDTLGSDVLLRPVEGLDVALDLDLAWPKSATSAILKNFAGMFPAAPA